MSKQSLRHRTSLIHGQWSKRIETVVNNVIEEMRQVDVSASADELATILSKMLYTSRIAEDCLSEFLDMEKRDND